MSVLKDLLYKTIHRNRKPLKEIAEEIDMSISYLTRSGLPDQEESGSGVGCNFPLKKYIPLLKSTKDYGTLDYIEHAVGRVAIDIPCRKQSTMKDVCRLSMAAVKEFGDLMGKVKKSIDDCVITDDEITRIRKEGYEAMQAIAALIDFLQRENERGRDG